MAAHCARSATQGRNGPKTLLRPTDPWEWTFHSVPDLIAVLDREHRIVRVNQAMAAKLGRTPEQCLGKRCFKCVHHSKAPPALCPHSLALADGKEHSAEVYEERLGGYFLVTVTPLRDETGQVVGCVHVARDITRQKKEQETLRRVLESTDHERHLMSCEIHDGLAQQLAGALMQFEMFDHLKVQDPQRAAKVHAAGVEMLEESYAEARRLIKGLRLPQLGDGGILGALKNVVADFRRRYRASIKFCCTVARWEMTPSLENSVYRIVQECLGNACRHSKSEKIKLTLTRHDDRLRIEVRDWGVGFDVQRVPSGHFGLKGIYERARVFGGSVTINSGCKGTVVLVELPLSSSCP